MNIAYGGSWGGSSGTDDECLPQQMQVDYVRVYQSDVISALAEKEKQEAQMKAMKKIASVVLSLLMVVSIIGVMPTQTDAAIKVLTG